MCMCVCMYVCMCVCVYVYIPMHLWQRKPWFPSSKQVLSTGHGLDSQEETLSSQRIPVILAGQIQMYSETYTYGRYRMKCIIKLRMKYCIRGIFDTAFNLVMRKNPKIKDLYNFVHMHTFNI